MCVRECTHVCVCVCVCVCVYARVCMLRAFAQQTHVRACPCVPAGVSIARISRGLRVHSGEGGLPAFGDVSLVAALSLASADTSETAYGLW